MKFLEVFSGQNQPEVVRPQVTMTVAEGFRDDESSRMPRARLCAADRKALGVVPGSLLRVGVKGREISCRVAISAAEDDGKQLIRLNPAARKSLHTAVGELVQVYINSTPLSSASVPVEVAAGLKQDQDDAEPVVRLGKAMRDTLGLEVGAYVNMHSGSSPVLVRVDVGVKGDQAVARLNPMARGILQVVPGDLVEIVPYETLVMLIDASGSMDESLGFMTSKMAATREALDRLLTSKAKASERDFVGLVTFAEECVLVADPSDDFTHLKKRARTIATGGRTAMFEGLSYVLELLAEAGGLRRTILLSDGCPTTTGNGLVLELAYKAKQMSVVIDTIGVGRSDGRNQVSYDEPLLRQIAELTGGKFTPVADVQVLEQELEALSEEKKIPLLESSGTE